MIFYTALCAEASQSAYYEFIIILIAAQNLIFCSQFLHEKRFGMEVSMKNRLEELRKERGIKQEQLASVLEVSRQTISSLEKGRYNPSIQLAFKIARYFEMSIEDIFIYEEDVD